MEYLVLARKWRPQTFEDVMGQEHVVRTLKNSIGHGRIAHAFIFSGPRGVGKTSIARIMAKSLNCEHGPTQTPCNVCANCREITEGISMDVREIDGASNRGIDEIRELRENIKFTPTSSHYKIYIIDEVHMLTREAFNALLKTLEEPPSHVIFVFATTEIHKVPATILSRCQRYDFRRVSLKQTMANLSKIAETENIRISETGLKWIAEAGDGSMRDAQSVFDQVISYAGFDIKDEAVEELLGLTDRRFLFSISKAVFARGAGACLKIIDEGYYAGLDMKFFYQMLLNHFRNLLISKIMGADREVFELTEEEMAGLKEQTENVSRETIHRLLDILMTEEENVKRSLNPRLNLETILVRMAYLEPLIPIDTVMSRMEGLEKRLSAEGFPSPQKKETVVEENPIASSGNRSAMEKPANPFPMKESEPKEDVPLVREKVSPERLWEDLKSFIKKQSHPLWSKIDVGIMLEYGNGVLTIGFPREYIFLDDINEKSQKDRLAELAGAFLGTEVVVRIEALGTPQKEENNETVHETVNNIQEIRREALHHPTLQKVLDVFGSAEVKDVIPRKNHQ